MIKCAKTIVVYTGAGISTSAGIADYRSWDGAWTSKLLHTKPKQSKSLDELRPTIAHMALYALVKAGIVKLIVSTNLDNLHRRSGVLVTHLAELHGNCYKEICSKCPREIFHQSRIRSGADHLTGNLCPDCNAPMMDSIINFGENLPEEEMQKASDWSKKADIALVLGSSLRVKPACWLTEYSYSFGNDGKIVICNLQKTDYENKSYLSIFNNTDTIMAMLMQKLGIEIPNYDPNNDPTERLISLSSPRAVNPDDSTNVLVTDPTGFAVDVIQTCPHAVEMSNKTEIILGFISSLNFLNTKCTLCGHHPENWYCLECANISCGRQINAHAESHHKSTNHNLVVSLADLSCWCYACNNYIETEITDPLIFALHQKKFSSPHPKQQFF
jgi:NAD-dependent SIR2 family protein deacetylase